MKENKKAIMVIGGTGIIGIPLIMRLIREQEYDIHSISLEKADNPKLPKGVEQHLVDRNTGEYFNLVAKLNSKIGHWDAVIDLIAFDSKNAEETYRLFKDFASHVITMSTTLVYDRSHKNINPLSEDTPLAEPGKFGGYVDGKLKLENFWNSIQDLNWTILRPYHILGAHSLLGCIPEHNRDPQLLEDLKQGKSLKLCNGGEVIFNYIHPEDIATAIYNIIGKNISFKQAYNLVNPEPITARDYYMEVARQIGITLKIENVSMEKIWSEMKGWEMTTLPHLYSMEKMKRDLGYVPTTSLAKGIEDSIKFYPKVTTPISEIPVHRRMNKLPRPKKVGWI